MDNRYSAYDCPALMQDGRFITNYLDSRVFDQFIRLSNKLESVHDYRFFLQNNAETIMNREREHLDKINRCPVDGRAVPLNNYTSDNKYCGCMCRQ